MILVSSMSNLLQSVERVIVTRQLLAEGGAVLVGVSGGVDSMVLLRVLTGLAPQHGWRLSVAHFNHGLRGRSSDADERLVRKTAEALKCPFVSERANVRAIANELGVSLEMAGRECRHKFFARAAAQFNATTIALAHHADDQMELFFLRLLRGSGSEGLGGMKWQSPSPLAPGLRIVRPLLGESKKNIRTFAQLSKVKFREDKSNAQLDIQRNRIRHELIPLLAGEYQPALSRVILRQMEILEGEADLATQEANTWLQSRKRDDFRELPLAVQRKCIQLQLLAFKVAPRFDLIEELRTAADRPITVSPGTVVLRDRTGELRIETLTGTEFDIRRLSIDLAATPKSASFGGAHFEWRSTSLDIQARSTARKSPLDLEHFDADKVGATIILRHWQPGDRYRPIGMSGSVKLQDAFSNGKISPEGRRRAIVGTTIAGEIFWVEGLRIADAFKLDARTQRQLQWRWKRL